MPTPSAVLILVLAGGINCASLRAQTAHDKVIDDHQKAIRQLMDDADSLPFEFRADIQLEAIEGGAFPRGAASEDVLVRLVQTIAEAKNVYPLGRAFLTADSVENQLSLATETLLALDALSVQIRAVSALAKIDRAKSLATLREVKIQIPPTICASVLIPDVTKFYAALDSLAAAAFSLAEKDKGEDVAWYEDNIQAMNSALQLVPVAHLLMRVPLTTEQFDRLSTAFATALMRLSATDREMAWLYAEDGLPSVILELTSKRKEKNLSNDVLFFAYRQFLVRSSSEVPCADQAADWRLIVSAFNRGRQSANVEQHVPALIAEDVQRDGSQGERGQMRNIPNVQEFDRLFGKIYALREKSGSHATPEQLQVDTEAWESEAAQLLSSIDEYDPSKAACAECSYIAKTRILLSFFDFCPDDPLKQKILSRLVRVLATSPLQSEDPVAWLFHVKLLLNLSRTASGAQLKEIQKLNAEGRNLNLLPSNMGRAIRDEMKHSGDYTMYVYAGADELLGAKYYSPYLP